MPKKGAKNFKSAPCPSCGSKNLEVLDLNPLITFRSKSLGEVWSEDWGVVER